MKKIFFSFLLFALCQATCKTTAPECVGKPVEGCICTAQYDPVCGCDKKTYGNACEANCAGIKNWTKGKCP